MAPCFFPFRQVFKYHKRSCKVATFSTSEKEKYLDYIFFIFGIYYGPYAGLCALANGLFKNPVVVMKMANKLIVLTLYFNCLPWVIHALGGRTQKL